MADKITVVVKDADLISFIERYAKQLGIEPGEAVQKLILVGKGRVKALVTYAKKLAAGEVAPPSKQKAKEPKAAKPAPKAKAPNAQPKKAKAKAPKVVKAAEPTPAPAEAAAQ